MKTKTDPYFILLHVALVALCASTVLLAVENRRLRAVPESATVAESGLEPVAGPEIDQLLDPIPWLPLDGEPAVLDLADGAQDRYLLVFTTDCPACQENQQAWRTLQREIGDAAEFVGISLSELEATRKYSVKNKLSFPVGLPAEPQIFAESLSVSAVPLTIRVGPDGRARGSWAGVLSEQRVSELSRDGRG